MTYGSVGYVVIKMIYITKFCQRANTVFRTSLTGLYLADDLFIYKTIKRSKNYTVASAHLVDP